ncbi:MAG: complex I NDUFA9 subunit family protein [Nitrospirae bacterium]|nr:complex I NDUFA9 subunit family protein [Nitrospirota bacterium]NTW65385.1 complex I NDUFA9 subunit family protein [Nitrospirota bacterium]
MILVTGANGFVGRNLVKLLRQDNIAVRALVRNVAKAARLRDLGAELAEGDISNLSSLETALQGCKKVIHLVGIIQEAPGVTFKDVHVDGTRNLLEEAKKAGVRHFIYQSALGTRPNAKSLYHRTKWEAEELVRASGVPFTILRSSLIYGPGDLFTIRLAETIKISPVLPVIGTGRSKVQPIFIDDVAACLAKIVTGGAHLNKVYEIGGPEQLTYEEVTKAIAAALGVNRPTVHMPLFFMRSMAKIAEAVLPKPPVTTDQLIMLQEDNICGLRDIRESLGIEPVRFREGLSRFLGK